MKKVLAFMALGAGIVWALSMGTQAVSQTFGDEELAGGKLRKDEPNRASSDTLEFRVHSFEECKRAAIHQMDVMAVSEMNSVENPDHLLFYNLYQKAIITKWAAYLGGDGKPAEYEFLFEVNGIKLASVCVDVYDGLPYHGRGPIMGTGIGYEKWLEHWARKDLQVADFEFVEEREKVLREKGVHIKKQNKLLSFKEFRFVIFEEAGTDRKIIAMLGLCSPNEAFPFSDLKGNVVDSLKREWIKDYQERKDDFPKWKMRMDSIQKQIKRDIPKIKGELEKSKRGIHLGEKKGNVIDMNDIDVNAALIYDQSQCTQNSPPLEARGNPPYPFPNGYNCAPTVGATLFYHWQHKGRLKERSSTRDVAEEFYQQYGRRDPFCPPPRPGEPIPCPTGGCNADKWTQSYINVARSDKNRKCDNQDFDSNWFQGYPEWRKLVKELKDKWPVAAVYCKWVFEGHVVAVDRFVAPDLSIVKDWYIRFWNPNGLYDFDYYWQREGQTTKIRDYFVTFHPSPCIPDASVGAYAWKPWCGENKFDVVVQGSIPSSDYLIKTVNLAGSSFDVNSFSWEGSVERKQGADCTSYGLVATLEEPGNGFFSTKTISASKVLCIDEIPSCPGGDQPDDNYSATNASNTNCPTCPTGGTPPVKGFAYSDASDTTQETKVAILMNGYPGLVYKLLEPMGIKMIFAWIPFSASDLLAEAPVLVIPSGGLHGQEKSEIFKASLAEYVRLGGTVICLDQQRGYEYSALPTPDGKPIQALGWTEDISCWGQSSYVDYWHPCVAGQETSPLNAYMDGHFFEVPKGSQTILRKSINGQPAMFTYSYGNGRVVAMSLYSDFAWFYSQASWFTEGRLFRDLISWGKKESEPLKYKPGASVHVPVFIENRSDSTADKIKLFAVTPNRTPMESLTIERTLAPGETGTVYYDGTAHDFLGIWWLKYTLGRSDSQGITTIQPLREGDRFAVYRDLPGIGAPYLDLSVTTLADFFVLTDTMDVRFDTHIFNRADTTITITGQWEYQLGGWWSRNIPIRGDLGTHTIGPNDSLVLPATLRTLSPGWGFGAFRAKFYNQGQHYLGQGNKAIYFTYPRANMVLKLDTTRCSRGDTLPVEFTLRNRILASYPCSLEVTIYRSIWDPNPWFKFARTLTLGKSDSLSWQERFPLPDTLGRGGYYLSAYLFYPTNVYPYKVYLDRSYDFFEIVSGEPFLSAEVPSAYVPGDTARVTLRVDNIGPGRMTDNHLKLAFVQQNRDTLFREERLFTLNSGDSSLQSFSIPIPEPDTGNYLFYYSLENRDGAWWDVHQLSNRFYSYGYPNRNSYFAGDTLTCWVYLNNNGSFEQRRFASASIVELGLHQTYEKTIQPWTMDSVLFRLPLPLSAQGKAYPLTLSDSLSCGVSRSSQDYFEIPPGKLEFSVQDSTCLAGDSLRFKVANTGGSPAQAGITAQLIGLNSGVGSLETRLTLNHGEERILAMGVYGQAVDGSYWLSVVGEDSVTGKVVHFGNGITLSGLKGNLVSKTDREYYLQADTVRVATLIKNPSVFDIDSALCRLWITGPWVPSFNKGGGGGKTNQPEYLWQTEVPVTVLKGDSLARVDLAQTWGWWSPGEYWLHAELTSATGQTIAGTSPTDTFYVVTDSLFLTEDIDREYYHPNDSVRITGIAKNLGSVTQTGVHLVVWQYNMWSWNEILTDSFNLSPGGSRPFTVTTTDTIPFKITTRLFTYSPGSGYEILRSVTVGQPVVAMGISAPDTVGRDSFSVRLSLQNNGMVPVDLTVNGSPLHLAIGQSEFIQKALAVSKDTTLSFAIRGDLDTTITKAVVFGEKADVFADAKDKYPEGDIVVPYVIKNTGTVTSKFEALFSLTAPSYPGKYDTLKLVLPPGDSVTGTLLYSGLAPLTHAYNLSYQTPFGQSEKSFDVLAREKATLAAGSDSLSVNAKIPYWVEVRNEGYDAFSGRITVETPFYSKEAKLMDVPSGTNFTYRDSIDLTAATEGVQEAVIRLYSSAGKQLGEIKRSFRVKPAQIEIAAFPQDTVYRIGTQDTMTFVLRNTGDLSGTTSFKLKIFDLPEASQQAVLSPEKDTVISFIFDVPGDIEGKDYYATYDLNGVAGTVGYQVLGVSIGVTASLDKAYYREGETAALSVDITNRNPSVTPDSMYVKVQFSGYDATQYFNLHASNRLNFQVPVHHTGQKLFYGIYHKSGRGVYLNTHYVNRADSLLTLYADKEMYGLGERATIHAATSTPGKLVWTAFELTDSLVLSGTGNFEFNIPPELSGGSYTVNYSYIPQDTGIKPVSGGLPIDVAGFRCRFLEFNMDKSAYRPGETFQAKFIVDSDRDLTGCFIRGVIRKPSGDTVQAFTMPVPLGKGSSVLTSSGMVTTSEAGLHKLLYGLYTASGLHLASGGEAFDVGDAVVLAVSTDKPEYLAGTEPVWAKLSTFGKGLASLKLLLDGRTVEQEVDSLSGYQEWLKQVGVSSFGWHTLRAEATATGLTSFKETKFLYGSGVADLVASSVYGNPPSQGTIATLSAIVSNDGKLPARHVYVDFYDGSPDSSGVKIGRSGEIDSLGGGRVEVVQYAWDITGKGGVHRIYAWVNPDGTVPELDTTNNKAMGEVTFPSITSDLAVSDTLLQMNQDVSLLGKAYNLTSSQRLDSLKITTTVSGEGGIVFQREEAFSLNPLETRNFNYVWNTGKAPAGSYWVEQNVSDTTGVVSYRTASFVVQPTILATGTLTAEPQRVAPGDSVRFTYTLRNLGNAHLFDLPVNVSVKAPDSSVVLTYNRTEQVLIDSTVTTTIGAVAALPPAVYSVSLKAQLNGLWTSLAGTTFEVSSEREVTGSKGFWKASRILCFADDSLERIFFRNTLGSTYYRIVGTKDELLTELRTGKYNTYVLFGDEQLHDQWLNKEIREAVNSGTGLVLVSKRNSEGYTLEDVLGVNMLGFYSSGTYTIALAQSPISPPDTVVYQGLMTRLVLAGGTEVGHSVSPSNPSVILHDYGDGKTVLFSFAIADTAGNRVKMANLLRNALTYVLPETSEVNPKATLPIENKVKSLGGEYRVNVIEVVPQATKIVEALSGGIVGGNTVTWNIPLGASEERSLVYLIRLPDAVGTYQTVTEIQVLRDGVYYTVDTLYLNLNLAKTALQLIDLAIARLDSLNLVSAGDKLHRNNAKNMLNTVRNRVIENRVDLEQNIEGTLGAIEQVKLITVDTRVIRKVMDALLVAWEVRWATWPE